MALRPVNASVLPALFLHCLMPGWKILVGRKFPRFRYSMAGRSMDGGDAIRPDNRSLSSFISLLELQV